MKFKFSLILLAFSGIYGCGGGGGGGENSTAPIPPNNNSGNSLTPTASETFRPVRVQTRSIAPFTDEKTLEMAKDNYNYCLVFNPEVTSPAGLPTDAEIIKNSGIFYDEIVVPGKAIKRIKSSMILADPENGCALTQYFNRVSSELNVGHCSTSRHNFHASRDIDAGHQGVNPLTGSYIISNPAPKYGGTDRTYNGDSCNASAPPVEEININGNACYEVGPVGLGMCFEKETYGSRGLVNDLLVIRTTTPYKSELLDLSKGFAISDSEFTAEAMNAWVRAQPAKVRIPLPN